MDGVEHVNGFEVFGFDMHKFHFGVPEPRNGGVHLKGQVTETVQAVLGSTNKQVGLDESYQNSN